MESTNENVISERHGLQMENQCSNETVRIVLSVRHIAVRNKLDRLIAPGRNPIWFAVVRAIHPSTGRRNVTYTALHNVSVRKPEYCTEPHHSKTYDRFETMEFNAKSKHEKQWVWILAEHSSTLRTSSTIWSRIRCSLLFHGWCPVGPSAYNHNKQLDRDRIPPRNYECYIHVEVSDIWMRRSIYSADV